MKKSITLAAAALVMAATPALADRPPTPSERQAVESTLRAHGFVAWEDIELDDGLWDVDDARHASGTVYDLKLRGGEVVKRDREWR